MPERVLRNRNANRKKSAATMAGILQYTTRILSCQSNIGELREEEKLADSVYQGIAKLYAPSLTPIKEYRSKPLTR